MTTIRIRATVDDAHRVLLTLPPEVTPGEHLLEITVRDGTAIPSPIEVLLPTSNRPKQLPPRPSNPDLIPEYEAFERMLPDLMRQHPGKYVALRQGVIVAIGDTEIDVMTLAHQLSPGTQVYARLVSDQPQPIPRIGSPRTVRRG